MEVRNDCAKTLETHTQLKKTDMIYKARSDVIFCVRDKAFRKVAKTKITRKAWKNLEYLYMTKLLAHQLCLNQ